MILGIHTRLPRYKLLYIILGYIFVITFLFNKSLTDSSTIKTFFRFSLYSIVIVTIIYEFKTDQKELIKAYLVFCKIICLFALIQGVGFLLKIPFLYDFKYLGIGSPSNDYRFIRVASLATEPAWMIQYLIPAIYLSIGRILYKDKWSKSLISKRYALIVLFVGFISQSSLFLIILPLFAMSFLLRKKNNNFIIYSIVSLSIICIVFISSYKYSESFRIRIDAITKLQFDSMSSENHSVFALLSNMQVTKEALKQNPIVGSGMDSYRNNYDRYIGKFYNRNNLYLELNSNDSGSFYLRILSEFGYLGFILTIFIFWYSSRHSQDKNIYYFYLTCFLIFGLRNGQYINMQFLFFFWGLVLSPNLTTIENTLPNRNFASS